MANNLYTVAAIGATIRSSKSMISIFNGTGSGRVLKVYKIWMLNNQSVAITGVQISLQLLRITSTSGGAALTPLKHNSSIANLPAQIVAAEGATNTNSSILRRVIWSTDEPIASASNMNNFELIPGFTKILYTQIGNSQGIEPIVLREGEGISLYNTTASNVGQIDIFMEFTADNT